MRIRLGYELVYECPRPTPMVLMLHVHATRIADLAALDVMTARPAVPIRAYRDGFGNWCSRIVAPAARLELSAETIIMDSGAPEPVVPGAAQHAVEDLPDEALAFLLGSRYCETDLLSDIAWSRFGTTPPGWPRVQAICDFVHGHIGFGYAHARASRTAAEAYRERVGVCRDFAHLAVTLCRCMNIPARYCTGYLGDIGVPASPEPMDFSAWFEAYLGGRWYSFDARHNVPRSARILMARGRDAADVAIATTFGPNRLAGFRVITEEIPEQPP